MKTMIMAGLLTLALGGVALATPTAMIVGTYNATTWGVWLLNISSGDNDGVASISFKVGGLATAINVSPKTDSFVGDSSGAVLGTFGFNEQHAANLVTTNTYEIVCSINAAQIASGDPFVLRGMGNSIVNYTITTDDGGTSDKKIPTSAAATLTVPVNSLGIPEGNYPNSFKVAQGNVQAGHVPAFVPYNTGALAGVTYLGLGENTGLTMPSGNITTVFLPEPATIALLAMGGLATLIRRRKK